MRKIIPLLLLCFICTTPMDIYAQADAGDSAYANEEEADLFIERSSEDAQRIIETRFIPDSGIAILRNDEAFWYVNHEFEKTGNDNNGFTWMTDLVWIMIIVFFVGTIIWYLSTSKIAFLRRRPTKILVENADDEFTSIFEINYYSRIRAAENEADFRLAVRLHFLELLSLMAQKNIINYKQDFTNQDYLRQLKQTSYYSMLFRLIRNYEYTWYGHFVLEQQAYNKIESEFTIFKKTIQG